MTVSQDTENEWIGHSPCRSTDYTLTLVVFLDGIEFVVNVLRDVPDKGKNLFDAIVHKRKCRQKVDDRSCDGMGFL